MCCHRKSSHFCLGNCWKQLLLLDADFNLSDRERKWQKKKKNYSGPAGSKHTQQRDINKLCTQKTILISLEYTVFIRAFHLHNMSLIRTVSMSTLSKDNTCRLFPPHSQANTYLFEMQQPRLDLLYSVITLIHIINCYFTHCLATFLPKFF